MPVLRHEIRPGAYADSIVLMQLQSALAALPGVDDAGAVMATAANLELLAANGLRPDELAAPRPNDLVVVVRAASAEAAGEALARVDELMTRRGAGADDEGFRPRTLAGAARLLPEAAWVSVSVPGRYAAGVAREALELGRHVFLYSDNVPLGEESELKTRARRDGLLVLGPDCGTALVGGVGLGFANRVRRGPVGIVAASGTGLQAVATRLHALGSGVSHALGTGGRDLWSEIGGATSRQALDLLARDGHTRVIVVVAKPAAPEVAAELLAAARAVDKPVIVWLLGAPALPDEGDPDRGVLFAPDAERAAQRAVEIARWVPDLYRDEAAPAAAEARRPGYLRALLAGGTLAYESQVALSSAIHPIHSNVPILGSRELPPGRASVAHTVLDLGDDELTVGRPHPMIDQDLLLRRLRREAEDPETGVVLLDLVLGFGAHPDPAAELAPAIAAARQARPDLDVVIGVVGTEEDPQGLAGQVERLREAGAFVADSFAGALERVRQLLAPPAPRLERPVDLSALAIGPAVINVGLEAFHASLVEQAARSVHVDWRPPAGGDERLQALLSRMKG